MEWWQGFVDQLLQTSWLEAVAVLTGIGSVWYSKQENILVYPVGIVSVLIYVYLAWQHKLYADSAVNFYYFVMSVYGWFNWRRVTDKSELSISRSTFNGHLQNFGVFALSFFILFTLLAKFTDSDVPMWDALTTAAAVTAMWLMARKKIEHWWFWLICNVISMPLYTYKGLPFTSFQFLVFTALAVSGLWSWSKKLRSPAYL
jgi:nicotinamide mononucleotide transporter